MNKKNIYVLSLLAGAFLPAMAQTDNKSDGDAFAAQEIEVGANKNFSRAQSTAVAKAFSLSNM